MRKLILTLVAATGLVLGGSAPAFAAPPDVVTSAGPYQFLESSSGDCGSYGFCDVFAQIGPQKTAEVCFDAYNPATDVEVYGCNTNVSTSALSFPRGGSASFGDITVPLSDGSSVTVSAQDTPNGEPVYSSHGSGGGSFDGCTYHFSYKETDTPVSGTLIVNGQPYAESGTVGAGHSTNVSKNCPTGE